MKEIYKINIIILSLILLGTSTSVFAADEKSFDRSSIFCSQWNEIDAKISSKITERETIFETKKANRITDLESKWAEIDAKREVKRTEADTTLATQIASLNTKATTEAQKSAISIYQTSVQSALEIRRTKIDAIILSYRTSVNQTIENRNGVSNEAIVSFKESVDSAINDITLQCESDISKKDIRANLKNAMTEARENLRNTIKSEDPKTIIENVGAQSKSDMEAAQNEFEQSLENARIELKNAFQ